MGNFARSINNFFATIIIGKRWKFVAKRFLSPPREFKILYGKEVRQTTMDNFVSITRNVFPVVNVEKKKQVYVQSSILKYIKCKK